jgi:hypothetical protein
MIVGREIQPYLIIVCSIYIKVFFESIVILPQNVLSIVADLIYYSVT